MKDELLRRLTNIKAKSPALLLEGAARMFREEYSKEVYTVNNQEELRSLVETFTNIPYEGLLVIEDISKVYDVSVLLKFLEEIETPVILLAYRDGFNINNTLLSRIKTLVKYPYVGANSNLISAREALDLWKVEQSRQDQDRFYANESPELYYLKLKTSKYVCNTKIVELLSKEE